jgi:PIN domain nuclease of toxin-antitoxin system
MTYLLDTHTFLWLLRAPEFLPAQVLGIAQDHSATLVLSLATPWEMSIKVGAGKLHAAEILDHFEILAAKAGYRVIETPLRQVIRSGRLPLHHKDPFDRLLAAQALDLRIPILSRNRVFDLYGVERIWD